MGDTSLLFNLLSRDNVSKTLGHIRTAAVATAVVMGQVGQQTTAMAQRNGADILALSKHFAMFGAAAVGGALIAGGALAALPILFAAVGAKLLAENEQVKSAFSGLGDHVKTKMTEAAQPLVPVFVDVAAQLRTTFDALLPAISAIFVAIGPMITTLTQGLMAFATNAMPGVLTAIQSAGPVFDGLSSFLSALGTGVGQLMANMSVGAEGAGTALAALGGGLAEILGLVGAVIGTLAQVGGPLLAAIMPVVTTLANAFAATLIPLIQQIGPVLMQVAVAVLPLAEAFGRLLAAVGGALGDTFVALGGLMVDLVPVLVSIIDAALPLVDVLAALLTPITPLIPAIAQVVATLVSGLVPILVQLAPIIGQLAAIIIQFVSGALLRIADAIVPMLPMIGQLAEVLGRLLMTALAALMPILDVIIDAVLALMPAWSALVPPVIQLVEAVMPLIPLLAQLVGWIVGLVVPAIAEVIGWVAGFAAIIIGALAGAIGWAVDRIPAAWQWIKDAVASAIGGIKAAISWFANLPGLIGGWISGAYNAAVDWFGRMVAWVRGLPGMILEALGNLGGMLVGVGGDMLRGLWQGIQDLAGWLKDRLIGFFKGLVPDWAKDALGISSPSTVMADQVGRWIPPGVAVGVDKALPELRRSMGRMVATIVDPAGPAGAPRITAPPAAGWFGEDQAAVRIEHLHMHKASPREVAQELRWLSKSRTGR